MSDLGSGGEWPPRWELPPDLPPPASRPEPAAPPSAAPSAPVYSPPPLAGGADWAGYQLPPDLPAADARRQLGAGPTAPGAVATVADGAASSGARVPRALAVGLGLGALLIAAAVVTLLFIRPWAPHLGPDGTVTPQPTNPAGGGSSTAVAPGPNTVVDTGPIRASASATCVSAPSQDSGGNPTNYAPANAIDDQPETAWRCDGNGSGQSLEIDLGRSATVTQLGIIPGLAKTDHYDNIDRYLQGRRISAVRYTLESGSYEQQLDTDPNNRSMQSISIAPTSTTKVVITILSSVPGSPVGNLPATDKVAISEVQVQAS